MQLIGVIGVLFYLGFIVYSLGNKLPEVDTKEHDVEAGNFNRLWESVVNVGVGIEEEEEEEVPVFKGIMYLVVGIHLFT